MLKPSLLRFIVKLQQQYGLCGPLLTLGVQDVLFSYDDADQMLRSLDVPVCPVPPAEREQTTAIWTQGKADTSGLVHARTFFRMLGIRDYYDVDASAAERPGLMHDFNQAVPTAWHNRFNWVLDSGTLEHIFDIRTALANVVRVTRLGGFVLHVSPTNGWLNHSFYQFSPCLFYDFYEANGFRPLTSFLAMQRQAPGSGLSFAEYHYTPRRLELPKDCDSALLVFLARKVAETNAIVAPVQRKYADRMSRVQAG